MNKNLRAVQLSEEAVIRLEQLMRNAHSEYIRYKAAVTLLELAGGLPVDRRDNSDEEQEELDEGLPETDDES